MLPQPDAALGSQLRQRCPAVATDAVSRSVAAREWAVNFLIFWAIIALAFAFVYWGVTKLLSPTAPDGQ
ncbi:hypothetical protein [Corynebacterium uterequi]|uniref:hypothetical protein n=1 Tax=Corynebacterium uterequi TaxID=1072256 RepID=UPI000AEE558C|nr:hypothetical protein [Corynebacterium uterequi]